MNSYDVIFFHVKIRRSWVYCTCAMMTQDANKVYHCIEQFVYIVFGYIITTVIQSRKYGIVPSS